MHRRDELWHLTYPEEQPSKQTTYFTLRSHKRHLTHSSQVLRFLPHMVSTIAAAV